MSPRRVSPRLPLRPLLVAAEITSPAELATHLGFGGSQVMAPHHHVSRFAREGLTERAADELACALGLHPANVWGDDWYALTDWWDTHAPACRQPRRTIRREPRWGLVRAEAAAVGLELDRSPARHERGAA